MVAGATGLHHPSAAGRALVLDADTTVKPLYGDQEGAVVGYNPAKPGRPSHTYHSFMIGTLRLMLEVAVRPGDQHAPKHGAPDLWGLLDRLGPGRQPWLLRGDNAWGGEARGRAAPPALSVSPAPDPQRGARDRAGDDGGRLAARRPGLGRPGDPTPPGRLEPSSARRAVAPQARPSCGDRGSGRAWPAPAELRQRRSPQEGLGVRRSGDLAGR